MVPYSYCNGENSRNENPASWEIAEPENTLWICAGSSVAIWKTSGFQKMAAVRTHPNLLLVQLPHQAQLVQILGNHRELKNKKIILLLYAYLFWKIRKDQDCFARRVNNRTRDLWRKCLSFLKGHMNEYVLENVAMVCEKATWKTCYVTKVIFQVVAPK